MENSNAIKNIETYKSAGKVTFISILLMFLFGIIFGVAASSLVYIINKFLELYLIVVFPILIGVLSAAGLVLGIRVGKCRNPRIALIIGLIVGIISYLSMHLIESIFTYGFKFNDFFYYLKLVKDIMYYEINDIEITGVGVWVVMGVELVIVLICDMIITYISANRPYLEECGEWCKDKRVFEVHSDEQTVISIFAQKEFEKLPEILKSFTVKGIQTNRLLLDLHFSSKCLIKAYADLYFYQSSTKKNKSTKRTFFSNALINDPDIISKILNQ